MTWNYNPALALARDQVRFLIGDTDSSDQQVQDEEITYALTAEGNVVEFAAARISMALSGKYARHVSKAVGDLRISYTQRVKHYADLAKALRTEGKRKRANAATPVAGGISKDDKESVRENTDNVEPFFERDRFTHPGTKSNVVDEKDRWD